MCVCILSAVLALMTGCGEIQESKEPAGVSGSAMNANDEVKTGNIDGFCMEYEEAYEKYPEAVEHLCEALKVSKDKLRLCHNFTDRHGLSCFDVGIKGDVERSGTYLIYKAKGFK